MGSWAGHRLELVTDEDHSLLSDGTWVDESGRLVSQLAETLGLRAVQNGEETAYSMEEILRNQVRSD